MNAAEFGRLQAASKARYEQAKQDVRDGGGFEVDIPEGDYLCTLNEIEKFTSKANEEYVKMGFVVCCGPHNGARITYLKKTEGTGFQWFLQDMGKFRIDSLSLDFEEFDKALYSLQDQNIVISISWKKGKDSAKKFANINTVLFDEEAAQYLAVEPPKKEDTQTDVPF